ncbi:MAG: hypothetical protein AB7I42_22745 [Bradyrhizobium sp.]|uniref:hypothetical protein n=1 Tax=Bradyrhizobium sp. TaxID=376 RepID=UPI003D1470FD
MRGKRGTAGAVCTTCGSVDNLVEDPNSVTGYRSRCADCVKAASKHWRDRMKAQRLGQPPPPPVERQFTAPELPEEVAPIGELRERRLKEWDRRSRAFEARKFIEVQIHIDGPIGILAAGDLHLDDPGCNWPLVEQHVELVQQTEALFAGCVGDVQNAWVGKLARLYGNQSTSAREAWVLCEWWVHALAEKLLFISAGNHDCVDAETEAFTRRGWLGIDDIREDDEVLGIDPATNIVHWQPIQAIIKKPSDGTIRRLQLRAASLACTGGHRVLHRKRIKGNRGWSALEFKQFDDIASFDHIGLPVAGQQPVGTCDLTDVELQLAAWLLTDSHISQTNDRLEIYQRTSKSHLVRDVLTRAGVVFTEATRDRDIRTVCGRTLRKKPEPSVTFSIGVVEARSIKERLQLYQKHPWPAWVWTLSDAQFEVFLSTLLDADGTRPKHAASAVVFYKSKPVLDELQALCAMHGYSAHTYVYRDNQYRLNIAKRTQLEVPSTRKPTTEEYHGLVWCLTVPLSNFLIRREGKAHFTGNCWAQNVNGIDPLGWVASQQGTVYGMNGARVGLRMPDGEVIVINCRHDFTGRSQFNNAHGVTKAAMFGHRDDILLAGHTHAFGYNPIKDPATGRVSHPIRLASYKQIDDYALERGFPDANVTEAVVIIYDPTIADPRHRIHVDFNPARGARTLTMLRNDWKAKQRKKTKAA